MDRIDPDTFRQLCEAFGLGSGSTLTVESLDDDAAMLQVCRADATAEQYRLDLRTGAVEMAWHEHAPPDFGAPPAEPEPSESIGEATVEGDGTLRVRLRAASEPGGPVGDATMTLGPDDPKHAAWLAHLGSPAPGQTVPVPPWPDAPGG